MPIGVLPRDTTWIPAPTPSSGRTLPRSSAGRCPGRPRALRRLRRGVELDSEPDRPIENERRTNQLPAPGGRIVTQIGAGAQRKRVRDRHQAGRAPQLGDQDGGIGLVPLASFDHLVRSDRETAALGIVEEAAEQRLGVEARKAQPLDAAVQADKCRCRPITD